MRRAPSGRLAGACRRVVGGGLLALIALINPVLHAGQATESAGEPSAEAIADLISRLGDADYQRRESAASALKAIGPAAVDPLLAAAELDGDLEVALRARWLVDAIPLALPHDTPEVVRLLDSYKRRDVNVRRRVMYRLLRVDDDAGIAALARIVRLERDPTGSREAATLLVQEWRADDPWWPGIAARAAVGLGASRRPAATFTRAVIDFSTATTAEGRDAAIESATKALDALRHVARDEAAPVSGADDDDDEETTTSATDVGSDTTRNLERCRIRMLTAAGRNDEAAAAATRLLEAAWTGVPLKQEVAQTSATLVWAADLGLGRIVDRLHALRPDLIVNEPLVAYAAAIAEKARGDDARAATLADEAFARHNRPVQRADSRGQFEAAIFLARWGCAEWSVRAYTAVLDDPQTTQLEFALAAIFASEYLHELDRDAEAAAILGRLFGPNPTRKDINAEQALAGIGRDHRTVLARMQYFASCAAAARGDAAERRRLLENALRALGKDIDSLIALYHLPDNTPDQRGDALRRINEALRQIENEIQGVPDDSNGYNEYAWLVANTEGDFEKAILYSKQSLVKSFDSPSYLDTLAHCLAAAGDLPGAVRCQSLAHRLAPHNEPIRKNLARFVAMAAKGTARP